MGGCFGKEDADPAVGAHDVPPLPGTTKERPTKNYVRPKWKANPPMTEEELKVGSAGIRAQRCGACAWPPHGGLTQPRRSAAAARAVSEASMSPRLPVLSPPARHAGQARSVLGHAAPLRRRQE